jgi:transcriptional regulator with XRE-family HTH domain
LPAIQPLEQKTFSVFPRSRFFDENRQAGSIGEVIKRFRKEKGLTQDALARNAHIDRTTIARVEGGKFKSLSVEKLSGIATALGIDLKALIVKTQTKGEMASFRGRISQAEFVLDYPEEGFRILSPLPKRKEFFFGQIEIKPQITVISERLPHPEQIYLHCLEGKLVLVRGGNEFVLKPGECFTFSGFCDYEFYNPDQLKPLLSLFITYPSFLSL